MPAPVRVLQGSAKTTALKEWTSVSVATGEPRRPGGVQVPRASEERDCCAGEERPTPENSASCTWHAETYPHVVLVFSTRERGESNPVYASRT